MATVAGTQDEGSSVVEHLIVLVDRMLPCDDERAAKRALEFGASVELPARARIDARRLVPVQQGDALGAVTRWRFSVRTDCER